MPAFVAGSMLMTIDAPYVCCWTWALVLVHRQLFSERPPTAWVWAGLGVTVGLGVLAKYNMVLFVPMLGLFLLTTPDYRRYLGSFGFWLMVGVAGLCCLPILVWNAQHDWITLRHVGRQAGMNHSGIRWFGPVQFLVEQAGLWLGSGFVAWLLACRERARDEQAAFLWWMSVPMVIFFMVFSVRTLVEPNWPVAAYVAGGVLTVGWIARNLHSRLVRTATLATMVIGLIATIVIHRTDWLYPLHAASGTSASVRKWDPTCRLKGWQTLAEAVAQLRERCRQDGNDPVLAGSNWALPGILAVYQADHPEVYSLGVVQGGRFSQYEFWRPNPVADPEPYLSRSFLYVGEISPEIKTAFERLEPSQIVEHHQAGQRVASWTITLCHGFRGFATIKAGGY
jgi:4-amino-4-deoxy-L-arabinose transferase-like glycosyltransferase